MISPIFILQKTLSGRTHFSNVHSGMCSRADCRLSSCCLLLCRYWYVSGHKSTRQYDFGNEITKFCSKAELMSEPRCWGSTTCLVGKWWVTTTIFSAVLSWTLCLMKSIQKSAWKQIPWRKKKERRAKPPKHNAIPEGYVSVAQIAEKYGVTPKHVQAKTREAKTPKLIIIL